MGYLSAKQINHLKDLQKDNYKGRRSFQGMSLRVVGLADAVIEFSELMEQCTVTERSRVIDSATPIALEIYKSIVPVSSKAHRISTNPFSNKKMQGWEQDDGTHYDVQPGNLRKSIIDLSKNLVSYKRAVGAIGPLYKRNTMNRGINSSEGTNGFYAHMVYGSTRAWYNKIVVKARNLSREKVIKQMRDECIFIMQERPKKFWQVS
jgi:hypothetical protein